MTAEAIHLIDFALASAPIHERFGIQQMSQYNPYQATAFTAPDSSGIRKVRVQPFDLFRRGRELVGEQYWLFVGITFLGLMIGSVVPFGLLVGIMMVGIYHCFIQRERGQRVEFSTLFKGFEDAGPPLMAMIIFLAFYLAILMPLVCGLIGFMAATVQPGQGGGGNQMSAVGLLALLGFELLLITVVMLVCIPFSFTFQIIAERRLAAMEAIKLSYRGAMKNFWGLLWFFFVLMFVSTILALLCYVPAILFLPISFASFFLLYRDIYQQTPSLPQP